MFPGLPDPLHPAVVHVPLGLAVILPLVTLLGALAVRRGWLRARSWAYVVGLYALLAASAFVAVETGEGDEDRVEKVVAERFVDLHHDRAQIFLWISLGALVVSGAGLLSGAAGGAARAATVVASAAVLGAAILTGEAGGALIYQHGAANAYLPASPGGAPAAPGPAGEAGEAGERQ
jgi:uncharacterized membrane protein